MRARSGHNNNNAYGGNGSYGSYGGSGSSSASTGGSYYGSGNNLGYGSYGGGGASAPSYGGYSGGGGYSQSAPSSAAIPDYNTADAIDADNKYKKLKKQATNESIVLHGIVLAVTTLLALLLTSWYWSMSSQKTTIMEDYHVRQLNQIITKFQQSQKRQQDAKMELERLISAQDTYSPDQTKEIERLQNINAQVQKDRDELQEKHEGPERKKYEARMLQRQDAYMNQVQLLQAKARRESKRTVLERFGPGPHQVKMTLEVPGRPENKFEIVLEMAPLSAVPHAIHLFLEQVEHGLWNANETTNCTVYLNSHHVLQMGPAVIREEEEADEEQGQDYVRSSMVPFQQANLAELSFPDYADEFPHEEWTIGFAGRPGGPDIYINKIDNSETHGPGGQFQHALEEQGDSCFGRVIQGFGDIQTFLYTLETNSNSNKDDNKKKDNEEDDEDDGWGEFVKNPVRILRAEIITPKPGANDQVVVNMETSTSEWTSKDQHRFEEDVALSSSSSALSRNEQVTSWY